MDDDDNYHREHSIGNQSDCHARGWEPVNSGKDYGLIFRDGLVTQRFGYCHDGIIHLIESND